MTLSQHDRCRGIIQNVGDTILGIVRIQWDIGTARLQNTQHTDDHFQTSLDADRNSGIQCDPHRPQPMRQTVCLGIELGIGQPLVLTYDGDCIGRTLNLRFKQLMQQRVLRVVSLRFIEPLQDKPPLV